MRMMMVNPKMMCNSHLLGNWHEVFMIVGAIRKGTKLDGYFAHNCLEIKAIPQWYAHLKFEMERRGMHPVKELPLNYDYSYLGDKVDIKVDVHKSKCDLMQRCDECRKRIEDYELMESDLNEQTN